MWNRRCAKEMGKSSVECLTTPNTHAPKSSLLTITMQEDRRLFFPFWPERKLSSNKWGNLLLVNSPPPPWKPCGALTAGPEVENLRARHLDYRQSFIWPVRCFPKIWLNRQILKTCISGFSIKCQKKCAHFEPLFSSGSYFWVTSVYPGQALSPLSWSNSVTSLPFVLAMPQSPSTPHDHITSTHVFKMTSGEDCTLMKIWIKNMLAEVTLVTHHCTCWLKY